MTRQSKKPCEKVTKVEKKSKGLKVKRVNGSRVEVKNRIYEAAEMGIKGEE